MHARRMMLFGLGFFVAAGVAVFLLTRDGADSQDSVAMGADADNPELVALGQEVYAAECAACHGENLEGQPNWRARQANGRLPAPPHDETGHTWHHPDAMLFDMTKLGIAEVTGMTDYETDMPAYGDTLSDREIWAVLAYLKSTWPPAVRARQEQINEQFRAN